MLARSASQMYLELPSGTPSTVNPLDVDNGCSFVHYWTVEEGTLTRAAHTADSILAALQGSLKIEASSSTSVTRTW